MVTFPNGKINLGLHITAKRTDGFHDLETVFYPVNAKDVLEILPQRNETTDVAFQSSGLPIDGDTSNNLCIKAYHLLRKDFPSIPPIHMHLHKAIPMGAGLGGGSADGAFTLQMLNGLFQLGLTNDQLIVYALQLGSDCPFFIINTPYFAKGRGEQLQPIDLDLSAYRIMLVNPGIHINTGWAFSQIKPAPPNIPLIDVIRQPIDTWRSALTNDFEAPVFAAHPSIAGIKHSLYTQGAVYAAMSGSGSTVFGLFDVQQDLQHLSQRYSGYRTLIV